MADKTEVVMLGDNAHIHPIFKRPNGRFALHMFDDVESERVYDNILRREVLRTLDSLNKMHPN